MLTKDELLDMCEDLFGPPQEALFAEFKRLLNNRADYDGNRADIWFYQPILFNFDCCLLPSTGCVRFAVPLSEIDFSQCLKCSPSYRALPKDYPKPKCTERSAEEASVLNDSVRLFVSFTIDTCSDYNSLPPSKFHF